MKLTNEIKEILEDIVWWDTCPTEYKFKINAYLKSVNEPKALNIDLVSESFKVGDDIIVCDDLITKIDEIDEEGKIWFKTKGGVRSWDMEYVIKHYSR